MAHDQSGGFGMSEAGYCLLLPIPPSSTVRCCRPGESIGPPKEPAMFDAASSSAPLAIDPDAIRAHAELIHRLAGPLGGKGKLVITAFGEDPDQLHPKTDKPGCPLTPI